MSELRRGLIPNADRTDYLPWAYRDEDIPVMREVFLGDVYHLNGIREHIAGGVCIDAGANIGCVTRQLLDLGAARVLAIEPEAENMGLLAENVTGPDAERVVLSGVAVGDPTACGSVEIVGTSGTAYSQPTRTFHANAYDDAARAVYGFAEVLHILDLLDSAAPDVALLKVDVEGAEYEWFRTASAADMSRIERIAMEWHGSDNAVQREVRPDEYGALLALMAETHAVSTFGHPAKGGMLYAHRYDL